MWAFASFEFRYQVRQIILPVVFIIFFLLTFGAVTVEDITIGATGNVNINSPYAITQTVLIMSLFGLFIPAAILANVVLRDRDLKTDQLIYSLPIRPYQYLLGRFVGAFPVAVLAFSSVPIAMLIGSQMPWLDPERLGPTQIEHYLFALFVIGVPNLLITGLIFFTVANLSRSMAVTYAALVGFLVVYFVGSALPDEPELRDTIGLVDPFGLFAFFNVTRYWTAFESNSMLLPLEGIVLSNRLFWLGVSCALLLFNVAIFSFRERGGRRRRLKAESGAAPEPIRNIVLPVVSPSFAGGTVWTQFMARTRFEVLGVVRTIAFWVLLTLGIVNSLPNLVFGNSFYGTTPWPLTRIMVESVQGTFGLIPLVVVIYYAAELIWRERHHKVHEIVESAPVPNWVFAFSKFLAMAMVIVSLLLVAMLTTITVQLVKGYTDIQLALYLRRLVWFFGAPILMLAALSMFVQVISVNRYLGMLIMVVVLVAQLTLSNMGFEHNLYQFGGAPNAPLSDMNGGGHFETIANWFHLYWGFFSALLIIGAYLLWVRGSVPSLPRRIGLMLGNAGTATGLAAVLAFIGFVATGGWIYYNTNVLNDYRTEDDRNDLAIGFEAAWRPFEELEQPFITAVRAEVDLFPHARRFESRGRYTIENIWGKPIETAHVDLAWDVTVNDLALERAELSERDETHNHYVFTLEPPMDPGEERTLMFDTVVDFAGFRNDDNGTRIVDNGTFIDSREIMPTIGVSRGKMLTDRNERRRRGLEPIDRSYKLEDEKFHYINALSPDSHWVDFDVTVSTIPNQIAIAPGYLERDWQENGRRYFRYGMDVPILNFFSFQSAAYEVEEDSWRSPDGREVALQVFYHAPHDFNIARMIESMKDSLAYFTTSFSGFQFDQMRIIEFPAYATFAQSFANTVPYSEDLGFIADLRDEQDIDYVYYVTAHEVAHQWWAHQAMSGNVQGASFVTETMSQYSALLVLEQKYGSHQLRRFLKYELDRYLSSRGTEAREELPLYRVESQDYIHYRKGAVAMYALRDYVGEETVNRALARLIEETAYHYDPYPTSLDFLRIIKDETEPQFHGLIEDLFERIVLWDLKLTDSRVTAREDGRFDVTMAVEARKLEADGKGQESEVPLDLPVDFGLFTRHPDEVHEGDDHVILLEKRPVVSGDNTITFTVDEKPAVVGVDPYAKLIDRRTDDNLEPVSGD